MTGWSPLFLVLGAIILTATLGRLLRRRRQRPRAPAEPPEARPASARPGRQAIFEADEAVREFERAANTRIHALSALIGEADERIRQLERLNAEAEEQAEKQAGEQE